MFTAFNLDWDNENSRFNGRRLDALFDSKELSEFSKWKKELEEENYQFIIDIRNYIIEAEESNSKLRLDGDLLKGDCFPLVDTDIFLSHSHADFETALKIKYLLEKRLGLKVFVDSTIWKYVDTLLKTIDNEYCGYEDKETGKFLYDYKKRNQTTAIAHLMLTTGLSEMMFNADAVFFLNTKHSTLKDSIKNDDFHVATASPWIYYELMMARLFSSDYRRLPKYRALDEGYSLLQVDLSADISQMEKCSWDQFYTWMREVDSKLLSPEVPTGEIKDKNRRHSIITKLYDILLDDKYPIR